MKNIESLQGKLLLAMPNLKDAIFERGVCYLCQHDENGTIGLVINHPLDMLERDLLLDQGMDIESEDDFERAVLQGGPMHNDRGFVIHKNDKEWRSSTQIANGISVTTSHDILEAIAKREVEENYLIILGYAAWEPDQLAHELTGNYWLVADADPKLLFSTPFADRWSLAMQQLGIHNLAQLSNWEGHA